MAKVKNETKVITNKVRLSYANIWEPKSIKGSEPKYSVSLLIPKTDTETINCINEAIENAKKAGGEKFGAKFFKEISKKTPLKDGDIEKEDDEVYAGHYFINANSSVKPDIVDAARKFITDEDEVYSGCYARVSINLFAFNADVNKGIGVGLNNIQKIADGEKLSGRASASEDFDDEVELDEDDDFL